MPRIPFRLILFLGVVFFLYRYVSSRRVQIASAVHRQFSVQFSAEDSVRTLVRRKILAEICPADDLCDYRPVKWESFNSDSGSGYGSEPVLSVIHEFYADEARRKFLFRIRSGQVAEIIDML